MATIAENLQTIKDSLEAIKQAIIDVGGTITGDITTYASAIRGINLITFTINETEYQAEEGMTWIDFYNSTYNVNIISSIGSANVYTDGEWYLIDANTDREIRPTEVIIANGEYSRAMDL